MERAWEDLQAGSAHHSGAGGFVPVVAAGWFPKVSAQLWGCAVVEGVVLWFQQTEEEHLGESQGKDRALHRVLTQGGCVVAGEEELYHLHWLAMPETLWMSSHWHVLLRQDSSGRV